MINLVVALEPEARPLIEHFGLEEVVFDGPSRLLAGGGIRLAITGIGKLAASRAVSALVGEARGTAESEWINVGLAGHRDMAIGTAILAHTVEDAATGERWHLHPASVVGLSPAIVRTVEAPESDYADDVVYEMEAAAFADAVSRMGSVAGMQVLKVVSDNREHPTRRLSAGLAADLIERQLPVIVRLIDGVRRQRRRE